MQPGVFCMAAPLARLCESKQNWPHEYPHENGKQDEQGATCRVPGRLERDAFSVLLLLVQLLGLLFLFPFLAMLFVMLLFVV